MSDKPLLLGIVGYSGTGKTTLLKKLLPLLKGKNIRTSVIKHSHHNIELDTPGKDSYELRQSGAVQTIVACDQRWFMLTETPHSLLDLHYLSQQFDSSTTDLVLVEGFKHEQINKIALYRRLADSSLNDLLDDYTIALASDEFFDVPVPLLDLNNIESIADFIQQWVKTNSD